MTNDTSFWAAEGTAYHAYAEATLKGRAIQWPQHVEGFVVERSQEGQDSADIYVGYVMGRASGAFGPAKVAIETQVDLEPVWAPLAAPEPIFGTADAMVLFPQHRALEVVDYKHGKGVWVPAESPQMMTYGLGALYQPAIRGRVRRVRLTVVQPRCGLTDEVIRSHDMTADQLLAWGDEVYLPGIEAAIASTGDAEDFHPGKYCKFCPARLACPHRTDAAEMPADFSAFREDARDVFTDL